MQTFKNPKPALAAALAESGPMENGIKKKGDESAKKKKRADRGVSGLILKDHQQRTGLTQYIGRYGEAGRQPTAPDRR